MSPTESTYRVVILYREPTYAAKAGPRAEPYRWTYQIRAVSPDQAQRLAIDEFRAIERLSSVGWAREIVGVEIAEAR